jgi:hypothetical protein
MTLSAIRRVQNLLELLKVTGTNIFPPDSTVLVPVPLKLRSAGL